MDAAILTAPERTELEIIELDTPIDTACVRVTGWQFSKIAELYDAAFSSLATAMEPAGPAYAAYTSVPRETVDLEIGFPSRVPLLGKIPAQKVTIERGTIAAGTLAVISHIGAYDELFGAWEKFGEEIAERGLTPRLPFFEVYVTEPSPGADPAAMRTDLYQYVEPTSA
ncbi:GyrI-like domain-containing protein [Dietzia sp.]|uniref:GyrI-like domain-containing protein n=1 Tax=Dietzia sp. TaxID=1871616 RepID=UPI002FD8AFFD